MLAYNIVNNTNTTYDYNEISNIINTDKEKVKKIYGVYDYNAYPTLLTPLELTNLILNNLDNELLSSKINSNMINELILVKEVMVSTINENKYTALSISKLLGIDDDRAELILKGQLELSEPEIQKNCEFFHCSRDYLLCYKDIDD